jgi:AcrR family transcriptional regulator
MPAVTNRHELRRRETREALRDAAVRRFEAEGFDNVSVADIAAEVGVTERTFYRHYATKEAVLFPDFDRRLEWLAAALEVRPTSETIFDSVRAAVRSYPEDIEFVRQVALLRSDLVSRERAEAHLVVLIGAFAREIHDHAAKRAAGHADADWYATVAANAIAGALVGAVDVWGQRGCHDDLERMVDRTIDLLRSGLDLTTLDEPASRPARRGRRSSRG